MTAGREASRSTECGEWCRHYGGPPHPVHVEGPPCTFCPPKPGREQRPVVWQARPPGWPDQPVHEHAKEREQTSTTSEETGMTEQQTEQFVDIHGNPVTTEQMQHGYGEWHPHRGEKHTDECIIQVEDSDG